MKERPDKTVPGLPNSSANPSVEIEDRRGTPRRAFIAEALVVELASGARLSGRCCDLVAHGCYMDTINPFQQGTLVRIRLQHGSETAEAKGKVVYRVPNLGMGISFFEITSDDQATLGRWISQASQEPTIQEAPLPPVFRDRVSMGQTREEQIVRLIQVLQKKGLLSKIEADGLLNED
jgi:hypothetical protein